MTLIVVAALIEHDGKVLACQRKRGHSFELLWEFPGGKVEAGESLREALARELREELAVDAEIGREVYRKTHHYADMPRPIELVFFSATADPSQIRNLIFEQIRWCEGPTLRDLDFLPADRELVESIAAGNLRLASGPPELP